MMHSGVVGLAVYVSVGVSVGGSNKVVGVLHLGLRILYVIACV